MLPITSTTECCFKTTVDRQMENASIKDTIRTLWQFLKCSLFMTDTWTTMELNTWTLGKILVEVSA